MLRARSAPSSAGRVVGLLGADRDPLVGGGDPVRQARHAERRADGGQQAGLGTHRVGLFGRLAGLLGTLAEGAQPVIDGLPEGSLFPDAGGGLFLGFRRGIDEPRRCSSASRARLS